MKKSTQHSPAEEQLLESQQEPENASPLKESNETETLKQQLQLAQEDVLRAQADYRNLLRRTQEDRIKMVKMAGREVIESLLQPLEHLYLAKEQLKDRGLDMVYQQFTQALQSEGLEEIECVGKEFDHNTMEVVEKKVVDDEEQIGKVIKVTQRGYRLNGEVIRHAKVVIGE